MASVPRGFNRLKKLAKQVPEEKEILKLLKTFRDTDNAAADRAAAVIGGGLLEHAIATSIYALCFVPLDLKTEYPEIFDGDKNGPASTFSARIRLGYALGLFGPVTREELECVKAIRNAFAHGTINLRFSTPEIAEICDHFSLFKKATIAEALFSDTPKDRYISTVAFISSRLRSNLLKPTSLRTAHHRSPLALAAIALSWGQLV